MSENFVYFLLIICLYLLRNVQLTNMYEKFTNNQASVYQYWLFLDAIILKANLNEILMDYKNAQIDLLSILQHTNLRKNLLNLPGICCSLVLLSTVKLCLIENSMLLHPETNSNFELMQKVDFEIFQQESRGREEEKGTARNAYSSVDTLSGHPWKSYCHCLSDTGFWKSYLPLPMILVVIVELAFSQLNLILHLQKTLAQTASTTSEDQSKKMILPKLVGIFQNLRYLYAYLQDKSHESSLLTIPKKVLNNFQFLPQSLNQILPDYDSNVLQKSLKMKLSWIMIVYSSLHYSLNYVYHHPISIYTSEEIMENKSSEGSNTLVKPVEEIYGMLSWGYQMEIIPDISVLWYLSHFYYLIDENMKEKTYHLLKQCHEKILIELNIRRNFYKKQSLGNNAISKQLLSIDIFLKTNDLQECKLNSVVSLLGFPSSILLNPYLAVASLAELILQNYSFNNSFQDYFFIEKPLLREFQANNSDSSVNNRKSNDLHEIIELIIFMVKQFYDSFGEKLISYIFNVHIYPSSLPKIIHEINNTNSSSTSDGTTAATSPPTIRTTFVSKSELDNALADSEMNKKLFAHQDYTSHKSGLSYDDHHNGKESEHHKKEIDFVFEKGLQNRYDIPQSISELVHSESLSSPISLSSPLQSFLRTLLDDSLDIKEIKGVIVLLIQLGKCFLLYLKDSFNEDISPAIKLVYLKVVFNIFYYLMELMELFLFKRDQDSPTILDEYFENSNNSNSAINNLFSNFYLLQMEIIFHYLLVLSEFSCLRVAIDLIKELLKPNPLQDVLSKMMIPLYLQQPETKRFSSSPRSSQRKRKQPYKNYWQKYERKLLHLFVLLITNPAYSSASLPTNHGKIENLSATNTLQEPERFALALSFLQKILADEKSAPHQSLNNSKDSSLSLSTGGEYDINIHYTMMLIYYYSGDKKTTTLKCEELMKEILMKMNRYLHPPSFTEGDAHAGVENGNNIKSKSSRRKDKNHQHRSSFLKSFLLPVVYEKNSVELYHSRYQLTKMLVSISYYCFHLNKFSLMKLCIIESWKFLYSIHPEIQERLQYISTHSIANISEHELIDCMRYVPTVIGRQLSNAHGFGVVHYPDLEAEILYSTGLALQYDWTRVANNKDNESAFDDHVPFPPLKDGVLNEDSLEFFQMAIHLYPLHVKSLLALANIYYEKYLKEMKQYHLNPKKFRIPTQNQKNIYLIRHYGLKNKELEVEDEGEVKKKKGDSIQAGKPFASSAANQNKIDDNSVNSSSDEVDEEGSEDSETSAQLLQNHYFRKRSISVSDKLKTMSRSSSKKVETPKEPEPALLEEEDRRRESYHDPSEYIAREDYRMTRSFVSANLALANFYGRRALTTNERHSDVW
jgi:hypothetical protein